MCDEMIWVGYIVATLVVGCAVARHAPARWQSVGKRTLLHAQFERFAVVLDAAVPRRPVRLECLDAPQQRVRAQLFAQLRRQLDRRAVDGHLVHSEDRQDELIGDGPNPCVGS